MIHKLSINDLKSFESIVILASCQENKDKKLMTKSSLNEEGILRAKYIIEYKQDGELKTSSTSYLDKAINWYNQIE